MKSSKKDKSLKIAVPFDYDLKFGFFLKPDMVNALHSRNVQILPLLYDEEILNDRLAEADGLLIPGGIGDLEPKLYGQEKKYDCVKILAERCEFEYVVLEKFLKTKKPILTICWGLQMLNVFLGGSLHQDIPQDKPSEILHDQKEAGNIPTHWIKFIDEHSTFISKDAPRKLKVNSTHHQAIDRLSEKLVAEAYADDGIIEAVRMKDHPFAWGVQWHPERLKDDPIIPKFLEACRR